MIVKIPNRFLNDSTGMPNVISKDIYVNTDKIVSIECSHYGWEDTDDTIVVSLMLDSQHSFVNLNQFNKELLDDFVEWVNEVTRMVKVGRINNE